MKKFFCLWALFLSTSATFASTTAVIPVTFNNGLPVVDLKLNEKTVPFVLDLGSNISLHLTPEVARGITGLEYTGKKIKSVDLSGTINESDEFVVSKLVVNSLPFSHLKGVIFSPWGLSLGKQKGLDSDISVLGLNFFEGKKILLNFSGKTVLISDEDGEISKPMTDWTPVPYEKVDEGLIFKISNGKNVYRMVLDSAATISMVKVSVAEKGSQIDKCDFDLGPQRVCRSINLPLPGATILKPILIELPDEFHADGILGTDFFKKILVLIDLQNHLIYMKPNM